MNLRLIIISMAVGVLVCQDIWGKDLDMLTKEANGVIGEYVSKFKPLDIKLREESYRYNSTGDKRASEREAKLHLAIRRLDSDKQRFEKLSLLYKDRSNISDPLVRRQIELIYLNHLPNQVSDEKLKRITETEKRLEEGFNDFRAEADGKKLSPVEVSHILTESVDTNELKKVWKSASLVGRVLEKDYRELVSLRNEIARELGYKDAIHLSAATSELDIDMLDRFYSEVAEATERPFRRLKEKFIDPRLAARFGIATRDLRPWHYQNAFFQEAPTAIFGNVNLDELYKQTDSDKMVKQAIAFYGSMGIDVRGIVNNSSLFPKPGKNPHAFAEALNPERPGSSVLLMNLPRPPKPPMASDVSTLIHELAHDINFEAVSKNPQLPYLLRDPTMLTEAIAMLFEQQTMTQEWFRRMGVRDEKAKETVQMVDLIDYVDQLIFLRWSSVIYCFERKFYANPNLDIGDLWWECRSRHQLLTRPEDFKEPDALAKYHISNTEPLYYSNYAIGRVANVQFAGLFAKQIGEDPRSANYFDKGNLGSWLMEDFLAQGERYRWDDFITRSTGQPLSVDGWRRFYIGSKAEKRLFEMQ